jgi:hypothetical protein
MAHRRAAARPHGWIRWLAVPGALVLDAAAAAYLAGNQTPFGVIVPETLLVAVPLVVYGVLAALVLRTRSLGTQLAAAAILLGIHVALIALHAVCYLAFWDLPVPAAIRLAHRWSPLIPLLQLVSVPLLASPLLALIRQEPSPAPRRAAVPPSRREVLATRASRAVSRARVQPHHEARVDPGPAPLLPATQPPTPPVAHVEVPPTVVVEAPFVEPPVAEPEPAPIPAAGPARPEALTSLPSVPPTVPAVGVDASPASLPVPVSAISLRPAAPTPVWFDELVAVEPERPRDDETSVPAAPAQGEVQQAPAALRVVPVPQLSPVSEAIDEPLALVPAPPPAAPAAPEPVALPSPSIPDIRDDARTPPRAVEPPVDSHMVARLFEPYGPLLSRDRTVLVDWTPGPDAAVLCAAPRGPFREQVVSLGGRLSRVLDGEALARVPGSIRRLSLRGQDGVVVITPLAGALLVAAARRRGALALLEVLSERVVPGPISGEPNAGSEGVSAGTLDASVSGATRVETATAIVNVLAPDRVPATPIGELAGRLLAVVLAPGGPALESLTVDLGPYHVMVHPVHPDARPPRFVAVVGGGERPGLLGRRTERAARALREAS